MNSKSRGIVPTPCHADVVMVAGFPSALRSASKIGQKWSCLK